VEHIQLKFEQLVNCHSSAASIYLTLSPAECGTGKKLEVNWEEKKEEIYI
jgi:hypothetical protein